MKRTYVSTLVASLALSALGLVAAGQSLATVVTPASTAMTASLVTGTSATLTPENGSFAVTVSCTTMSATFTTPSSTLPVSGPPFFNNRPAMAPPGLTAGGMVLMSLGTPSFTNCSSVAGVTTTVSTNSTNGKWALGLNTMNTSTTPWRTGAVGVPKSGAAVLLVAGAEKCELTIDPENAQPVTGVWENGTTTTPSKLLLNAQVFYAPTAATKATCEGATFGIKASDSPAALKVALKVEDAAKGGLLQEFS